MGNYAQSTGGQPPGGGGSVTSVNSGVDITVDNTDPDNPIVNYTGGPTIVANYAALPAVGTVAGKFYWCSASQGTKWLPGSLGGTYYSAGMYRSNGVTWEFIDVSYQATQADVDAGIVTDQFVTPATLAAATTVISKTGTTGDLISFSATNTPSRIIDVATGNALISGGVATLPSWGKIGLTTHISGVLAAANGGTGVANTGTITLGGNLVTTGAFNTTLATGFTGTITLPTATSTLATLALVESFTNKTLTSSTNTIGGVTMGLGSDAVGDMYYGGASNVLTRLASVTAGSYLRSGGTTTAPLWSTLKLPNAATANYIAYATSTNTWGENSGLQFSGTTLMLGGASAATDSIAISGSNSSRLSITTQNTNSAGNASFYFANDRGFFTAYGGLMLSGSASSGGGNLFGLSRNDALFLFGDGASLLNMAIGTLVAKPLIFGTNNAENMRIISGGAVAIGATALIGTEQLLISKSQNSGTTFRVYNNNAGAATYAGFFIDNGTSNFAMYQAGNSYTSSGQYIANGSTFESSGVGGLSISTLATSGANASIRLYTNNGTLRGTISVAGLITWSSAYHVLAAGTATAATAPLKFTTGTSLTTAEAGAFEYTTPQLFFTNGGAQRQELIQAQQSRVSTQFDATTNTTLANITGLTATLVAGKNYKFTAKLHVTADVVGGSKFAIAGTATATAIIYEMIFIDNTSNANTITSRQTALAGSAGQAGTTSGYCLIEGLITVNAAGTITAQFAQNASNGTSSILVGSTFLIEQIA